MTPDNRDNHSHILSVPHICHFARCHLVGMREFQDVASTVPLLDDDRLSSGGCGSMTFDTVSWMKRASMTNI